MLEYYRIDIAEGIDVVIFVIIVISKILALSHSLTQKAMNFNYVVIVSFKGSDYRIHFWYMGKDDAINIMNNYNLNKKRMCCNFFLLCIKMSECNFIERNSVEQT